MDKMIRKRDFWRKTEINKLDNVNFEDINLLDIHNEITYLEHELVNISYEEIDEILTSYISKVYKKSCSSYKIKNAAINNVITKILQMLIEDTPDKIWTKATKIYIADYSDVDTNDKNLHDLIKKSLNYLRCLDLARYYKRGKNTSYKVRLDHWFANQKYNIKDTELLKLLAELLVEYVKSSEQATVTSFFDIMDNVLNYLAQPYQNHNSNINLEEYLFENFGSKVAIRIFVEENVDKKYQIVINEKEIINTKIISNIIPIRIIIYRENKVLEYEDKNNKIERIELTKIIRIILDKKEVKANKYDQNSSVIKDKNNSYMMNTQYMSLYVDSDYFKEEYIDIILELPLTALEYYKIKPLANMTIYETESEKNIFENKYSKETKNSHFYVVSNDTKINAINNLHHVLSVVKILEPIGLIGEINKSIFKFSKNNPF